MKTVLLTVALSMAAMAAEDGWAKVKALKSGVEVRIQKAGEKKPIEGKLDEANDERLVLVVKNTQMGVAREEVEKLEARPGKAVVTRTTTTKNENPAAQVGGNQPRIPGASPVPALQSTSSGVSYGGKPPYELVYRKSGNQ